MKYVLALLRPITKGAGFVDLLSTKYTHFRKFEVKEIHNLGR